MDFVLYLQRRTTDETKSVAIDLTRYNGRERTKSVVSRTRSDSKIDVQTEGS